MRIIWLWLESSYIINPIRVFLFFQDFSHTMFYLFLSSTVGKILQVYHLFLSLIFFFFETIQLPQLMQNDNWYYIFSLDNADLLYVFFFWNIIFCFRYRKVHGGFYCCGCICLYGCSFVLFFISVFRLFCLCFYPPKYHPYSSPFSPMFPLFPLSSPPSSNNSWT